MPIDATSVKWDDDKADDSGGITWDQPAAAPKRVTPEMAAGLNKNAAQLGVPGFKTGDPIDPAPSPIDLPFLQRAHLKSLDNNEEKRLYLSKVYGSKAVTEKNGKLLINGRQIEDSGVLSGIAEDTVGNSPQLAGMAAGAAGGAEMGAAGGPLTALAGGVLGAGIGAFSGKGMQEGVKAVQGEEAKSPSELGASLSDAAVGGVEGEMGGRVLNKGVERVMTGRLPEWFSGTTKETADQAKKLINKGANLPTSTVAPNFKKFQRVEAINKRISGAYASADTKNRKVLEDLSKDVLKEAGIPESQLDAVYKDIASGEHAVDTKEAGAAAQKAITAHKETILKSLDNSVSQIEKNLDTQLGQLNKVASSFPAGALGVDVGQGFIDARKGFSTAFSTAYKRIDTMIGGKPVVPLTSITREVKKILRASGGVQPPGIAKQMEKISPEQQTKQFFDSMGIETPDVSSGKITLEQAQRMRTVLREKATERGLTQGVTSQEASRLQDSIDRAIQEAQNDPAAKDAIPLLRDVDKRYATGIKKFNDAEMVSLAERYKKTGITPDPQQVVEHLIRSGESSRAEMFKKLLPEDVWRRVRTQDLRNIIDDAKGNDGKLSSDSLLTTIAARGKLLESVHGEKTASLLRSYSRHLAVFQEKLPAEQVTDESFMQLAAKWQADKASVDTYMKDNFLNELTDPKKQPEAVYDYLTEPGQTARLKKAMDVIGPNSEEARLLTSVATKKLVAGMVEGISEGGFTVKGAIDRELKRYTAEQQKMLFPNDLASSLRQLARDAQMMFPDRSDESMPGFSAGNVLNYRLIPRLWYQFMNGVANYLIRHQSMQRYLFLGRERGPHELTDSARSNFVRFFVEQANQRVYGDDSEQPDDGSIQQ